MISLIDGAQENVTIVSLGPLTNVASALEAQPSIKSKIDKIQIMGGAVEAAGNVGPESGGAIPNYVAEWNMYVDPHAADIVFQSGVPITQVTLDATNNVPVTDDFKTRLEGVMVTPEARLVYNATTVGLYFWDQLAVVSLTNPEVVTFEEHHIEIVVDLLNHEGQTNSTGAGSVNAIVAVNADADAFEDLFIGYINGDLPTTSAPTTPTNGIPVDSILIYAAIAGVAVVAIGAVVCMRRK
ncbi:MAG: nucleoside hydrolase [Candidatus Thorarchaeota archaeon]